ncbi:copper amine oxidase N-terminal domain-containing protein [Desulfotomaculum copahuensis]|nr:copper amine oxidase N-terminal domain-containing protein [Desulfotomaculum copahuensis]
MKKRLFLMILTLALTACLPAVPALAAGKINLTVNGNQVTFGDTYQENGVSMVQAGQFARFSGVALDQDTNGGIKLTQGKDSLVLTPGSRQALLNGKPVTLPVAPEQSGNEVSIPLRFVSGVFGFQVGWDGARETALLSRNQLRDGMTPEELLAKSNQACQAVNTYSMTGDMNMNMNMAADGKPVPGVPKNIKINLTGSVENNPLQMYIKENIVPDSPAAVPAMVMEMYMNQDKMYIKPPGQPDWLVSPAGIAPDFIRQQQQVQSDPIKAVQQMKELGILLNYSDDATINGNDYYVINATIDQDKFRQGYAQLLQQAMQGMPGMTGQSSRDFTQAMQKLLDKANVNIFYTAYINKKTLINDLTKINEQLDFNINPREMTGGTPAQPPENVPQNVHMEMTMQGNISISGLGQPFKAPDVSKARDMSQLAPPAPAPAPAETPSSAAGK